MALETQYDKLMACVRFAETAYQSETDSFSRQFSEKLTHFREQCERSAAIRPKSQIAQASITPFFEVISGQLYVFPNDRRHAMWQVSRRCVAYFIERFPKYHEKRTKALERVIKRGSIRTEFEYRVVEDVIYELEGAETDADIDEDRLNLLYQLSDDAEF